MTAVRIRPLASDDLDDVVRVDAIHTGAEQRPYWVRLFRDFVEPGHESQKVALAAEFNGGFAGFLLADVRAFEFGSEPCGWIMEVGIDPAFLRLGLASDLLDEAVAQLKHAGVTTVRTMVRRNNIPVLTFFRTNGFIGGPYLQLERVAPGDES
jgi:ribosomal protein S18 acetylase RimI-like enzyme